MSTPAAETQDKILKFYQEVATYAQQANQGKTALAQGAAQLKLAQADADTGAQSQIKSKVSQIQRVTDVAIKLATETANVADLAGVEKLLGQLEARLANYGDLVKAVRAMEAQFELAIAMGEFDEGKPGETREVIEGQIADVQAKADKQLALAEALVPTPSLIVQPSKGLVLLS